MVRHPSAPDQRAMALFLAKGHYDAHIRRHRTALAGKWKVMLREIERQLPDCTVTMTTGGSALWLRLPHGVEARAVQQAAAEKGVLVEAGDVHFLANDAPRDRLRLGFAAIAEAKIAAGIELLAKVIEGLRGGD
jgi:GntR family transcriptional regulator/MocR family aminotransferase